jgi:hypothetical protein
MPLARSFERYLSKLVRDEYKKRSLMETDLLLSGLGARRVSP